MAAPADSNSMAALGCGVIILLACFCGCGSLALKGCATLANEATRQIQQSKPLEPAVASDPANPPPVYYSALPPNPPAPVAKAPSTK